MNAFSSARRVALCPPKPPPPRPRCLDSGSLTEEQKRERRRMRFSGEKSDQDWENGAEQNEHALYGYVSRGEHNRLQKSETAQREYFDWILETFKYVEKAELPPALGSADLAGRNSNARSEQVLTSLRKLREALLHEQPSEFSKKVHLFSVRVSSAVGHYQTYIPSIQYLLADGNSLLTPVERSEIASILVLHVTHRTGSNSEGLRLFFQYLHPHKDCRILQSVEAWALGDYHAWMELYNSESDHSVFAVMSMGLLKMMRHMIACFNDAYYTYSLEDLKKCLPKGVTWEEFKERYAVPWELEGNTVYVKRRQLRGKSQGRVEKNCVLRSGDKNKA